MTILVTGGAGYIGSHVVKALQNYGHKILVADNLTTGWSDAVPSGELLVGNVGNDEFLKFIFTKHDIDAVIHLAASVSVAESWRYPLAYYRNNVVVSHTLIDWVLRAGIEHFIFSSSAAVYGNPMMGVVDELFPVDPINPYGRSKLMTEQILRDVSKESFLRHVILRYFNVIGCGEGMGQRRSESLMHTVCEAALDRREFVPIYGTDYPTADGTCVRDYIHVSDVAYAHVQALHYLMDGKPSTTLNCGYGVGYSVRELIANMNIVADRVINTEEMNRRAGDPPIVIADARNIRRVLNWHPVPCSLRYMCQSSFDWERSH
jgi:UDP-glucose 4-epimerase